MDKNVSLQSVAETDSREDEMVSCRFYNFSES
jgi:hypothetical protein